MLRPVLACVLFSLTACYASTVDVTFTGLPLTVGNGTYNGFSFATVNGETNQLLICDDYNDTTYMPSSNLIYDYSTLTGADPLQYAMFNPANYDEAAVLVYELAVTPNLSATAITDLQYALWNLMTPSVTLVPGRSAQEQALQASALALVNNASDAQFLANTVYAGTAIYTPTAAYAGNQEFIEYSPPVSSEFTQSTSAAPEPSLGWPLAFLVLLTAAGLKVRQNPQRFKW